MGEHLKCVDKGVPFQLTAPIGRYTAARKFLDRDCPRHADDKSVAH
ncbi:Uncharacterised protein [Vibrio cholerae]|nr:Uncharacterised protein [Vibrio cholerae]CSI53866.1 Uncharacterised protein [Vibrio cholerae]